MLTCVTCVLLLTKSWTYACIFPPMKHVLFYSSVCDDEFGATFGPIGGSAYDHF
jgi:hypothetical protein